MEHNTIRENAIKLLRAGHSATQIAIHLNVPVGKIYYWRRYYMNGVQALPDGRRLYDDQFKQDVLDQIINGANISQLARSLGISKVTLFKWKREHYDAQKKLNEAKDLELSAAHASIEENVTRVSFVDQSIVVNLLERIQVLEEEKAALKRALQILVCNAG